MSEPRKLENLCLMKYNQMVYTTFHFLKFAFSLLNPEATKKKDDHRDTSGYANNFSKYSLKPCQSSCVPLSSFYRQRMSRRYWLSAQGHLHSEQAVGVSVDLALVTSTPLLLAGWEHNNSVTWNSTSLSAVFH